MAHAPLDAEPVVTSRRDARARTSRAESRPASHRPPTLSAPPTAGLELPTIEPSPRAEARRRSRPENRAANRPENRAGNRVERQLELPAEDVTPTRADVRRANRTAITAETEQSDRTRHVKDHRRHRATPPEVVATRVAPRSGVREQRAGRRRVARLRALAAVTLTALGVGATTLTSGEFGLGRSDDLVAVEQSGAMAGLTEWDERHPRPPRTITNDPSQTADSTATRARRTNTTTSSSPANARAGVVLDGRMMGGLYNGASGVGVTDGSFQSWLGQPVTLAATWADTDDEVQRTLSPLQDEYRDWQGGLDLAVGGTILGSGENYAEAANGAYDDRWRAAAKVLAETRKGKKGPTFVRPFHEMNCDWYANWTVTRDNSADFKKAFARYAGILRAALPEVYVAFSPNYGTCNGLPISEWYPGDDVVDVIAPDYYNDYQDQANGSVSGWNDESDTYDNLGNPTGPEAWRRWAAQHGKPMAFPEVGLKPASQGGGDKPEWIKGLNAWLTKNANTATWQIGENIPKAAAGKVLYFAYFNVCHEGDCSFTIHGQGANPESESVYRGLKWGNNKLG
ncbi:MAG: glycosyl hydrolase [Kineosporiaceae bacterium]